MILVGIILLYLFINEILNTDNIPWIVTNVFFALLTGGTLLHELTKKEKKEDDKI